MLTIPKLDFGYRDAENYKRRENKKYFNNIFHRTGSLDELCKENIYFLVGDKGTGKTAYAVYLSNNDYKNNLSSIKYIRETDYQKFITLKEEKHLVLSDYTNIWKVILYLLLAEQLNQKKKKTKIILGNSKFRNLKKAIDEYYAYAFSPEIAYAIHFIEESKRAAELLLRYVNIGGEQNNNISFTEKHFQTNLLFIEKKFEESFRSLKLSNNYILFIDGIDLRPSCVPYIEYLDCVKGLANAIWNINNDFFPSIKDSIGRLRVVLLLRPDIFNSLSLQNQNSKLRDNSVILDWRTNHSEYRHSSIFMMVDHILESQQNEKLDLGITWDFYFPFNANKVPSNLKFPSSFIDFLRYSLYRPRNIITILDLLQENFIQTRKNSNDKFNKDDLNNTTFTRKYSEYLLGEIKDQLSFYYSNLDYELFRQFFIYLGGCNTFTYDIFLKTFARLDEHIKIKKKEVSSIFESPDNFLQFLYETNIICYIIYTDNEPFLGWCFRERSISNLSPRVKTHANYSIHFGMRKALNLDLTLRR